jgi:hypothetical protein
VDHRQCRENPGSIPGTDTIFLRFFLTNMRLCLAVWERMPLNKRDDAKEQIRSSVPLPTASAVRSTFLDAALIQHQHDAACVHHGRLQGQDGGEASKSRLEDDGHVTI